MGAYVHPEVLVETDWVKENLGKPGIKVVEIDVDTRAYDAGHIPGAVGFNWQTALQDQVRHDILVCAQVPAGPEQCEELRRHLDRIWQPGGRADRERLSRGCDRGNHS